MGKTGLKPDPNAKELLRPRMVGAATIAVGLVIAFLVVPSQTREASRAVLQPAALPMMCGLGIALCGLVLVFRPTPDSGEAVLSPFLRILFFAVAVYFVTRFLGYMFLAPTMVLSLMLTMGERRLIWLIIGVVGVPAACWVSFAVLLGRQLP